MASLSIGGYVIAPHVSQLQRYQPGASLWLQSNGCTVCAGTNGMNTVTGRRWTGDDVRKKVPVSDESNPGGGWSLNDLDLAMARIGVGFEIRTGRGRAGVRDAWAHNLCTVIQGDSEEFSNNTCSGAFNGDHCICVFPARKLIFGAWHRWVADSICPAGRWERETEIWQYAENLNSGIRYGVFTKAVAKVSVPLPDTTVATHRAYFARGADVKIYALNSRGQIMKRENGSYYWIIEWTNAASSAPCTAPVRRKTADGLSSAVTVTVLSGKTYGRRVIAANSSGVTIKEI